MIIKAGKFQLRSIFQVNPRISLSGRMASLLCVGKAVTVTLTSSLLPDNGLVESDKFFISLGSPKDVIQCPYLKVKVNRLALRLISTSLS